MSDHHIVPLKTYMVIFAALLVCTVITVAIAYVDLGFLNTPVAIFIAMIKATLVIWYFMHVKYSPKLVALFAFSGFFWLIIMFSMTMQDYYTRGWQEPLPIPFLEK